MNRRIAIVLLFSMLWVAGCSNLPGLQVLTGDSDEAARNALTDVALIMGDKTGATNAAWLLAADRIEAAVTYMDIIEVTEDPSSDAFIVYAILEPAGNSTSANLQDRVDFFTSLRQAIEL